MVSITQLEYVVAIDQHGHFGKAAEACFVTQPTLSMQIQKLEEDLQVQIFDRTKKPIVATSAGKKFIEQAKAVLREVRVFESLNELEQEEGELSLAIIPTLAPYISPLFLSEFSKNYPKIRLLVRELTTEEIIQQIQNETLDVGLLVTPLHLEEIEERSLFFEEFFIYCHPESPIAKKKLIKQGDLSTEGLWLLQEGHCFRQQVLNVCGKSNSSGYFSNVKYESGSFEALKNLIDSSGGYTFLPRLAARYLLGAKYQSKIKNFANPVPVREVSLVYLRRHHKSKMIGAMEDIIKKSLPANLLFDLDKRMSVVDI